MIIRKIINDMGFVCTPIMLVILLINLWNPYFNSVMNILATICLIGWVCNLYTSNYFKLGRVGEKR